MPTKKKIDIELIRQFSNIGLLAKTLVEGFMVGLHRSPLHGFSVEFAEHRPYNTGESTRHIDWKVYAKTDRLYTKRYDEETNLRAYLLLDTSSSMYYPLPHADKLTFSIMSIASLAYLLHKQRDAFALCTFDEQISFLSEMKSTASHLHQLFSHLEDLLKSPSPKHKTTALVRLLHQLSEQAGQRALFVLFTDAFDNQAQLEDLFGALQHLKHKRHEVLFFHVLDHRTELFFEFGEQQYEFIDLETGQRLHLYPSRIRTNYQQRMKHYLKALRLQCGKYGIDYIDTDTRMPFDQILRHYLIKRNRMT